MKTIEITLYKFEELSKEAQQKAIEKIRDSYYEHNNFAEWAIDDCYLFEPKHKELVELFGEDFYKELNKGKKYTDNPLINNNRSNIYFSTDRNWHLDCAEAMEISNDKYFLLWLGLTEEIINGEDFNYHIFTPNYRNSDTTIEFEGYDDEADYLIGEAIEKFNNHINECLKRIESNIDHQYTDEAIIEEIECNDYDFTETGEIY